MDIFRTISLVNAPVPGPNYATHLLSCSCAVSVINQESLLEEGAIAPVSLGLRIKLLTNLLMVILLDSKKRILHMNGNIKTLKVAYLQPNATSGA